MKQVYDDEYTMNEYQIDATITASYPSVGDNVVYPALGFGRRSWRSSRKD